MYLNKLHIDSDRVAKLCEEYNVRRLELFGSFVRGDASPASDVDVLVTFQPDAKIGLRIVALQQALESLFGRSIDFLTRQSVEHSPNKFFADLLSEKRNRFMSALDPRERDLVKCEDMRIHAERAREFLGRRSLDQFLDDDLIQAAVIRCVEVVGEAA